ncbi:MAG: hypothetical protein HY360_11750, partial [Verrucomicrobia bacterium]|nr:hypothetical protein [Verrucomicrobiota bacterium]
EQGALWGFLTYDPAVESIPAPPRPAKILAYFEDSGFAHFHDDAEGVALNVQCGPWCGYNAYRRAQGPCDRMNMSPGAGHFSLLLDGQSFLVTPIGAYRLTSDTRSILLVDGRGQHGDVGYPMSIPSWLDHGEEIEWVRWDAATGTGVIRLKLHPAYPAEFGMLQYTRELHVGRSHEIICRDQVLFDKPRRLSWLFQIKRKQGAAFEQGLRHRIGPQPGPRFREEGAGHGPTLWIEAKPLEIGLQTRIEETELVWSYSALEHDPFDRIRYDTIEPVSRATVDFILIWT